MSNGYQPKYPPPESLTPPHGAGSEQIRRKAPCALINMDHIRRQSKKYDELCTRLYACNALEITESERVLMLQTNICIAALIDENTALRELI